MYIYILVVYMTVTIYASFLKYNVLSVYYISKLDESNVFYRKLDR